MQRFGLVQDESSQHSSFQQRRNTVRVTLINVGSDEAVNKNGGGVMGERGIEAVDVT